MIIKDPSNGDAARVEHSRLQVGSVSRPEDKNLNTQGRTFSLSFDVTPAAANSYFFYLKNTGLFDLLLTDVRIRSSVASAFDYDYVTGTPVYVTGTNAARVARKLGSPDILDIEAKYDTNITGLTDAGLLFSEGVDVANRTYHLAVSSNIILPQGSAIAFKRIAATGAVSCTVSVAVDD